MAAVVQRSSMLGQTWDYHHEPSGETVLNVEGLCRKVLGGNTRSLTLEQADWDDALRHLLGEVTVIAAGYKPRDAGSRLGGWVSFKLKFALSDYLDSRDGRSGEKRVFDPRHANVNADHDPHDTGFQNRSWVIDPPDPGDDPEDGRLGRATAAVTDDGVEARSDALLRFLETGNSRVLRPVRGLGRGTDQPAENGHSGTGERPVKEAA